MTHRHLLIVLPACMLLFACKQDNGGKTGNVPVIEIVQNFGKYQAMTVSRFVSELEYIPLETNDNCLFGDENHDLIVTATQIFVRGSKYCYAFNRNGRFLGQIGRYGQGPGEYSNLIGFFLDENNQSIYLETSQSLLEYSWDGVFQQSIHLPKNIHGNSACEIIFVRDNLFIGHFRNHKGNLPHNFVLFNQSSEVVKLFDNHLQFNRTREMATWRERAMKPYRLGEHVYVKELANDTLFCLTEQNELVPRFVFDLGKFTTTKEKKENKNIDVFPEEIVIPTDGYLPMIGTQSHIFFSFRAYGFSGKYSFPKEKNILKVGDWHVVVGLYDIANRITWLLDRNPVTRTTGLINDLDGGLSFWPLYYSSNDELIDIWRACDMKENLTESYFAAHKIKNPQAHQKLKELLQKLDEFDNPVIVIGKSK